MAASAAVFRRHFAELARAIQDPDSLARELYSKNIITDTVRDDIAAEKYIVATVYNHLSMTSSSMHIRPGSLYMATMSACHLLAQARPHDVVHLTSYHMMQVLNVTTSSRFMSISATSLTAILRDTPLVQLSWD